jgi:hypothetical protein
MAMPASSMKIIGGTLVLEEKMSRTYARITVRLRKMSTDSADMVQ